MNYLAHLHLSAPDAALMAGNYIGDFVKGKNFSAFPKGVAEGIIMHRSIDHFTDTHPLVLEAKSLIRPRQGKWSGVVMDMFFDHFLAKEFEQWQGMNLEEFTTDSYQKIAAFHDCFPERAKQIYQYMSKDDWLLSYATETGICQALAGISNRVRHPNNMKQAYTDLKEFGDPIKGLFREFYQELQAHCISGDF